MSTYRFSTSTPLLKTFYYLTSVGLLIIWSTGNKLGRLRIRVGHAGGPTSTRVFAFRIGEKVIVVLI